MELTEVKALLPDIAPESEYGVLVVFMKAVLEWMENHEKQDNDRFQVLPTKADIDAVSKKIDGVNKSVQGVVTIFNGGETAAKITGVLGKFLFHATVSLAAFLVAVFTIYVVVTGKGIELVQSMYHLILPKK